MVRHNSTRAAAMTAAVTSTGGRAGFRRGTGGIAVMLAIAVYVQARASAASPDQTPAPAPASGQGQTACVALMLPSVQGADGSATDIGNGVRDLFASFLNGPAIKTIALDARLESQAMAEAKQKSCPHVLVLTLTVKHGGGGLMSKAIGQGLSAAAWHAPLPGPSAAAAIARSAVIGGAETVSTLATSTKAKDEMQLEYRLAAAGDPDHATATKIEKAKARSDREDLLTPLAERVSKAIVSTIARP